MTMKGFMVAWNNRFPLDREWRRKYNIAFNSPEHRAVSQLDIYLEFVEDEAYKEAVEKAAKWIERDKLFKEGTWLTKNEPLPTPQEQLDAFDNLDLSAFNSI